MRSQTNGYKRAVGIRNTIDSTMSNTRFTALFTEFCSGLSYVV